ncbi:serine/threonine protein kinase [Chloroflexota bacterium]
MKGKTPAAVAGLRLPFKTWIELVDYLGRNGVTPQMQENREFWGHGRMNARSSSQFPILVEREEVIIGNDHLSVPNITFVKEIIPPGANGRVFEAYDDVLQRRTAVKIWIPQPRDPRDRKRQALAEVAKIAQLDHANIVRVYGAGELKNGWIYSIMEFLEGETLNDFLQSELRDFMQRVRIWREIEGAIEYAHDRGVYHGDLHNRNVIIVEGTAKVIDFGTSLFAQIKAESRSRESKHLFSLSQDIFCDYEPSLKEIVDMQIQRLKPELALEALSVWVSALVQWQEILTAQRICSEKRVYEAIKGLAFDMCAAPVFAVPRVVDMLAQSGISKTNLDFLTGWCVYFAGMRMESSEKPKRKSGGQHEGIVFTDRQLNESLLETLWPSLRSHFLDFGPFD